MSITQRVMRQEARLRHVIVCDAAKKLRVKIHEVQESGSAKEMILMEAGFPVSKGVLTLCHTWTRMSA